MTYKITFKNKSYEVAKSYDEMKNVLSMYVSEKCLGNLETEDDVIFFLESIKLN